MIKVSTNTELIGVETCMRSGTLQGISLQYSDKGHLWNATVVGMMIGAQNMRGTCDTLNLITHICEWHEKVKEIGKGAYGKSYLAKE